jgi:predicted MFS family arabinose efflux permease
LLGAAGITVLAYGGAFTFYTYVSTLLQDVSGLDVASISTVFLLYGLAAAAGNIIGGKFADNVGPVIASGWVVAALAVLLLCIAAFSSSALPAAALVVLLGFAMFAAVPILQAKILQVASDRPSSVKAAASGMNIAGFNFGITFGSLAGHATITIAGVAATPLVGAFVCLLAFIAIVTPLNRAANNQFHS